MCDDTNELLTNITLGIFIVIAALVGGILVGNIAGVGVDLSYIGLKVLPAVILGGLDSVLGAILGGLIGGAIGNRMDAADRREANRATYHALESASSGNTQTWKNPDSNNSGSIRPTNTYQAQNGQYCREYEQTITVSGETRQAYGTACRQPDGTWKMQ